MSLKEYEKSKLLEALVAQLEVFYRYAELSYSDRNGIAIECLQYLLQDAYMTAQSMSRYDDYREAHYNDWG